MPSLPTGKNKGEVQTIVPFPPYDYRVYVIFTNDLIATADRLAEEGFLNEKHGVDDTTGGFHVRMPNQSLTFIVLKPIATINEIAHEAYHTIVSIFQWIGAKHEEEMFAYHLGYLVQLIVTDQKAAKKVLTKAKK